MKKSKIFAVVLSIVMAFAMFAVVGCDDKEEEPTPATQYTVVFKDGDTEVKKVTVNAGAVLTAEDVPAGPTKEGQTFVGWFNGETEIKAGVAINADTTATAKYNTDSQGSGEEEKTTYTVTYASGATDATGTAPTQAALEEGKTFTVAANTFTRPNYYFVYWTDGTNNYAAGEKYAVGTSNVTLTAVWGTNNASLAVDDIYTMGGDDGTTTLTVLSETQVKFDDVMTYYSGGMQTEPYSWTFDYTVTNGEIALTMASEDNDYEGPTSYTGKITDGVIVININKKNYYNPEGNSTLCIFLNEGVSYQSYTEVNQGAWNADYENSQRIFAFTNGKMVYVTEGSYPDPSTFEIGDVISYKNSVFTYVLNGKTISAQFSLMHGATIFTQPDEFAGTYTYGSDSVTLDGFGGGTCGDNPIEYVSCGNDVFLISDTIEGESFFVTVSDKTMTKTVDAVRYDNVAATPDADYYNGFEYVLIGEGLDFMIGHLNDPELGVGNEIKEITKNENIISYEDYSTIKVMKLNDDAMTFEMGDEYAGTYTIESDTVVFDGFGTVTVTTDNGAPITGTYTELGQYTRVFLIDIGDGQVAVVNVPYSGTVLTAVETVEYKAWDTDEDKFSEYCYYDFEHILEAGSNYIGFDSEGGYTVFTKTGNTTYSYPASNGKTASVVVDKKHGVITCSYESTGLGGVPSTVEEVYKTEGWTVAEPYKPADYTAYLSAEATFTTGTYSYTIQDVYDVNDIDETTGKRVKKNFDLTITVTEDVESGHYAISGKYVDASQVEHPLTMQHACVIADNIIMVTISCDGVFSGSSSTTSTYGKEVKLTYGEQANTLKALAHAELGTSPKDNSGAVPLTDADGNTFLRLMIITDKSDAQNPVVSVYLRFKYKGATDNAGYCVKLNKDENGAYIYNDGTVVWKFTPSNTSNLGSGTWSAENGDCDDIVFGGGAG